MYTICLDMSVQSFTKKYLAYLLRHPFSAVLTISTLIAGVPVNRWSVMDKQVTSTPPPLPQYLEIRPNLQIFSYVGTGFPGLNQY